MARFEAFSHEALQAVCDVLAETDSGLTGSEIGRLLKQCGIPDPQPGITKRHRLFEALSAQQRTDGCGNNVVSFILAAMKPVRYVHDRELFEDRRASLNGVLSFAGLELGQDGELRATSPASTIDQAQERAGRLRKDLSDRRVHPDVLRFCKAELLQDNYFHAVFEATKSVAEKIRVRAGLTSDGSRLVDEAFGLGGGYPRLAFNALQTETERSEHTGLMNLLKGLFGAFRNVTAHAPKITWPIAEQDALDILTLTSLLHRRLDAAIRTHVA